MDNLFRHIFIEFYYRNGKFLNEHNSKLTFRKLNESYGVFDGCYELAKQIYNNIKKMNLKNGEGRVLNLHIKNCKWIETFEIMVYYDENSNTGATYNSSSQIVKSVNNTRKYLPLKLSVNLASNNIVINLMHELTHAYEDYNRQINDKPSITDKALENGYYLNNSVGNYDYDKKYISYILYYLTDFEVNAHLSQLKGELQNCDKYFVNIQQIVDFLKKTDVYKRYSVIKSYIDFFSNISDEKSQSIILSWVSDLSTLKFRTYKNFVNYINKKYNKIERHMNRLIPKIAYEYLDYGNTLNNFNGKLSELKG